MAVMVHNKWFLLLVIFFYLLVCLSIFSSCSRDDDSSTNKGQANDDDDDDDFNLSDPLGPGEVRAGQITAEDELIGGPRARGEIGDYKIYNSRIEIIIRSPDNPGVGWTTASGNIIDADRARPPAEDGADSLWVHEQIATVLRGLNGTQIEVAKPGKGGLGVITVTGKSSGIDIIDDVIPMPDGDLEFITEYTLLADVDYISIKTTLINKRNKVRKVLIVDVLLWGDEMRTFSPRAGFDMGDVDLLANLRWVGAVSRLGLPLSYAFATTTPDKALYAPFIDGDILPVIEGFLELEALGQATYERLFIVADGDTSGINTTINQYDQATGFATLTGTVNVAGGDLAGVEIEVTDQRPAGKNYVGVLLPDGAGDFALEVEPGLYTLVAKGQGRADSAPVSVTVTATGGQAPDLTIDPPGWFDYSVINGAGNPTPSKIFFQNGHDAPMDAGISLRVWGISGGGVERVLPGNYTVTASRGFEYEIDRRNITITAGQTSVFNGTIVRSVDTTGHMTGDFHIHTQFSIDSQVIIQTRIRELVSAGVEMPVFTDHDFLSDYEHYVAQLDVEAYIRPVAGNEVSPYFGHFNTWSLEPLPGAPDYYGVPLVEYTEDRVAIQRYEHPELWDIARDDFGAQVIQINHPRSGSAGWFNHVGYDPTIGVSSVYPARWREDFDAIEVFNSGGEHEGTLEDWFSFLDQGLNYTLTGNSDSHSIGSELGNPRNIFAMPTDNPGQADPQDMIDSILAHRNQVSIGPFVTIEIEGASMGSLVSLTPGSDVDLVITVQAPMWMEVNYLRVWSNNQTLVQDIALAPTGVVIRYDDTITLSPGADAYYVVETGHTSATLGPVVRGERVFAMTNPIWVNIDGNGVFDPPGLAKANYGQGNYESKECGHGTPGLIEYFKTQNLLEIEEP